MAGCWRELVAVVVVGAFTWSAAAQAPVESPDLNQRLEKLEKQNEELSRRIQELQRRDPSDKKVEAKPAAAALPAEKSFVVGDQLKLETIWKNGMIWETSDKAFKFSVGGTVQFDAGGYMAPQGVVNSVGVMNNYAEPALALSDGMDFRRARLRFNGTIFETIEYFAQYDFAQTIDLRRRTIGVLTPTTATAYDLNPVDGVLFNEVWVGITELPLLGAVRIGHIREGLNFITSTGDRNQIWMERGLLFDAFNSDFVFSSGVSIDRTYLNERLYSWIGMFENNSRNFSAVGDGNYAYDVRLTGLPIWDPDHEFWLHVGVDYSYRNLTMNQVRYRARPMVRIGAAFQANNILDTGTFFSNDAEQIANVEFASACGPWTIAAEASRSWVTNAFTGGLPSANGTLAKGVVSQGTYVAQAAYAELCCFLTPDHRNYRKDRPGYDRIVPRENFFFVNGDDGPIWSRGAWEVGVRYDYLDLTHRNINGGTGQAVTACVNWYLNPNTRFQWNYFVMHRQFAPSDAAARVDGDLQGVGFRVNMDF